MPSKFEEGGEAAHMAGLLKQLAAGARIFQPTGGLGTGPGAEQAFLESLQSARDRNLASQQGPSNISTVSDAYRAADLGASGISASDSTVGAAGQEQPRGTAERIAREEEAGAPLTGVDTQTQAVADAIQQLTARFDELSRSGLRLPEDFTSTMAAASEAVIRKLEDVGVTSLPTDITVGISEGSITSIAGAIGTATAGAAVGAQQIAASIDELKNELLEDQGLVDQRITASVEDLDGRLVLVESETGDLDARVIANTGDLLTINDVIIPGLEQDVLQLTVGMGDLTIKVDDNAVAVTDLITSVGRLTTLADDTAGTVEAFQAAIDDVTLTSERVVTRMGQFEDDFITIQATVAEADANAEFAVAQVGDLRDSLTEFRRQLDAEDIRLADAIRLDAERAQKTKDELDRTITPTITQLKRDVAGARQIADRALGLAGAAKRV
jgi:hypothetical protein